MATMTSSRVLYTAKTHTMGAREGESRSSDGRLAVKFSLPGTPGNGTNPEQLFAAGWSACFEGAMSGAARQMKVSLPSGRGDRRRSRSMRDGRRVLASSPSERQRAGRAA